MKCGAEWHAKPIFEFDMERISSLYALQCIPTPYIFQNIILEYYYKMRDNKNRQTAYPLTTGDGVINEYFRLITNRDIADILALFDEDAVVYEPFSKENGLHGSEVIRNFLKVAFMANSGLNRAIKFESITEDKAVALLTFERGDSIEARFSFLFVTDQATGQKKIRELRIQFI